MTWSAPLRRRILRVVEAAAEHDADALALLPSMVERRAPVKAIPTRAAQKTDARQVRRGRVAEIRLQVFQRDNERCVLCENPAQHMHHLLGGGLRRAKEAVETCASLCRACHREVHDGDRLKVALLVGWAERHASAEALSAVRRRLAKIARVA